MAQFHLRCYICAPTSFHLIEPCHDYSTKFDYLKKREHNLLFKGKIFGLLETHLEQGFWCQPVPKGEQCPLTPSIGAQCLHP